MKFQKGNPGRPRGAKNKISGQAKAVIAEAAQNLGGVDRLVAWVRETPENERHFWATIYTKILPFDAYVPSDRKQVEIRIVRHGASTSPHGPLQPMRTIPQRQPMVGVDRNLSRLLSAGGPLNP